MRAGARGIGQQLADQVGRAFGGHRDHASHGPQDVWNVATHEDERTAQQPPECTWCPLCRAIRLSRESGPGLAGQMSGAADALATAAQDALQVLDDIMSRSSPPRDDRAPRNGQAPDGQPWADRPHDEPDRPGDGPGDR